MEGTISMIIVESLVAWHVLLWIVEISCYARLAVYRRCYDKCSFEPEIDQALLEYCRVGICMIEDQIRNIRAVRRPFKARDLAKNG